MLGTSHFRSDVSHSARIWNYWLGGMGHYPVDAEVGDHIVALVPALPRSAVADRRFLARAVRHLAGDVGIRQFLDIGTGLPITDNTHEIAQRVNPACRVVCVDNDPLVFAHAHALLTSTPEGAAVFVEGDIHDPEAILRKASATLDLTRPVALTLLGVLNFVLDTDEAASIVRRLLDAVPSGSHVVISHPTTEVDGEAMGEAVSYWNAQGASPMTLRSRAEVIRLFEGARLLDPGVVTCTRWRPEGAGADIGAVAHFAGVGVKA
ncbi:SAM-dependent methyltransferase [Streptomyces acidiscabies]|uniref:SAM-dependent methyltransferase n=1 Tax=Streptomyces acidiscabies TaxID=42234 RepID=UPI0038F7AEB5